MKNKTAAQWLEEARASGADWADKAFENIKAQPRHPLRRNDYPLLSSVVMFEFAWAQTDAATQGYDYWWGIYKSVERAENQNQ